MTDAAKPEPGWYVVTAPSGQVMCIRRGEWGDKNRYWDIGENPNSLAPDWTLGPRVEDLLRDAERNRPRRLDEYHEDFGEVLWWTSPISEPPYVGSPLCNDWEGYHTHWTVISEPHFDVEIAKEKKTP